MPGILPLSSRYTSQNIAPSPVDFSVTPDMIGEHGRKTKEVWVRSVVARQEEFRLLALENTGRREAGNSAGAVRRRNYGVAAMGSFIRYSACGELGLSLLRLIS